MRTSPWSAVVLVACAAFVIAAAWIRVHRLADIDLFCDEALGSEIASSLWQHGELNPLRFSDFLPQHQLRNGVFIYFPPLSYAVAAPFTALRDRVGANLAPRLPALLSGLLLIALLLPAGRAVFGDTCVGLGAAALTTCNWFHVGMSRMALPYSLLPTLLLLSLLALLRALRRNGIVDWLATALTLTASAYVNQVALLFWALIVPGALTTTRSRWARLGICFVASATAFLVWVALGPRTGFFANSFFATTADYRFTAQLAAIAAPYREMLRPWPLAIACVIGVCCLVLGVVRHRDTAKVLLLTWLLLPGTILLTRSMWIHDYHLYFVFPAVILVAAYGVRVALLVIDSAVRGQTADGSARLAAFTIAIAVLCTIESRWAPPPLPNSAHEFGSADIVSRAADYIRRHDRGEAVIAPVGTAEAYYLERYVHSKNRAGAVEDCLDLVSHAPAWVFMGDNYFHNGRLDACDELVRQRGTLIMHSAPIASFTDPGNPLGYALYHLEAPVPPP